MLSHGDLAHHRYLLFSMVETNTTTVQVKVYSKGVRKNPCCTAAYWIDLDRLFKGIRDEDPSMWWLGHVYPAYWQFLLQICCFIGGYMRTSANLFLGLKVAPAMECQRRAWRRYARRRIGQASCCWANHSYNDLRRHVYSIMWPYNNQCFSLK